MDTKRKADTVSFTAKGQIVIPAWLRKEFDIQMGSKAVVQATADGILLKPVTRHTIGKLHGILKRQPGGRSFAQEWAEHKREERKLENAKDARHRS